MMMTIIVVTIMVVLLMVIFDVDKVATTGNEEANGKIAMTDASSEVGPVLDHNEGELFLHPCTCRHHSHHC